MGLNKSKGNMYEWVTHTWSPIIGCSHQCEYCYVKAYRNQPAVSEMRDNFPNLRRNNTIFVGHLCDMFSEETPAVMVDKVIGHCLKYPENAYVFQTKNPKRLFDFQFPDHSFIGSTIETNRAELVAKISKAPSPAERAKWMAQVKFQKFITIEPILDFDTEEFADLIASTYPEFVSIGADSKKNHLPEPTREKVMELADALNTRGIVIRKKLNLERLVKK